MPFYSCASIGHYPDGSIEASSFIVEADTQDLANETAYEQAAHLNPQAVEVKALAVPIKDRTIVVMAQSLGMS
jgi:hypothetical protein